MLPTTPEYDPGFETPADAFPYDRTETSWGVWLRHTAADGRNYAEFRSNQEWFGLPLLHVTRGINPVTGRRKPARGIFAVGRVAIGVFALGQVAAGVFALGQVGVGLLIGIGQLSMGIVGVGQLALCGLFSLGQVSTGYVTIGQFGFGEYVVAQFGFGAHVIDTIGVDPDAVEFFERFLPWN